MPPLLMCWIVHKGLDSKDDLKISYSFSGIYSWKIVSVQPSYIGCIDNYQTRGMAVCTVWVCVLCMSLVQGAL